MIARLMGLETISPAELHRQIEARQVVVIDVNSRPSWMEARVPGALHLDPEAFGVDHLPADRAASLVFYCSNPMCRKAPKAALRAKQLGYGNVKVMSAGMRGWLASSLPTDSGEPASA